ncbi:MAG: competence/damage-inducible protein A [bacterium]
MKVEIIAIGTELLLGELNDTNSTFIARELTSIGYDINYIIDAADETIELENALNNALNRSDIIITTGGIGPTSDDITRQVIADVTGHPLYKDENLVKQMEKYFDKKNYTITPNNYRQTYLPEGAKPIENNWGTAPGILLETGENIIISLPGVPEEMKNMLRQKVIPYLMENENKMVKTSYFKFFGIGESTLETKIKDILDKNNSSINLSLLAGRGEVRLRITVKGNSETQIDEKLNTIKNEVNKKAGKYIYGIDNQTLPEVTGNILKKYNLKLGIAESCTGGLIGSRITNIPGSSKYFEGGIIAYSNQIKINELKVSSETIKQYGAVSEQTALEMAKGISKKFKCDLGLSVTGIAGPGGGTANKPVGLVYIGVASSNTTEVYKLNLNGNRKENKWRTSQYALNYLRNFIKNKEVQPSEKI